MKHIVFIGMPGSGKTTVSRRVAERLNLPWHDTDLDIAAAERKDIPSIFSEYGEQYFRKLETDCIRKLLFSSNITVVATGGGAVLHNEKLMVENAVVVYLKRSVDSILSTMEKGTRPLVSDADSLRRTYENRREIYERAAAVTVENDGTPDDTVEKVLDALRAAGIAPTV